MSFKEALRDMATSVDGCVCAVLMGYDGIPIDDYISEDAGVDVSLMMIEYSSILKDARKTIEVLQTGELEEFSINTTLFRVLMRAINEDLFAALVIKEDGNFGKGRYVLKMGAPRLRELLA